MPSCDPLPLPPSARRPEERGFRMPRPVRRWTPVVLSALVQVPAAVAVAAYAGVPAGQGAVGIALAAIGPALLAFARRWPGPVAVAAIAAATADVLLPPSFPPFPLAAVIAIAVGIVRGARLWVYPALAVAWVTVVTTSILTGGDVEGASWAAGTPEGGHWRGEPAGIVFATVGLLMLVGVSESVRARRERMQQRRRLMVERRTTAEQAERVRIARELHDVIAHSLSQISVQAGVGLHLMDRRPEQARESLVNIRETSRMALDEVRGVLGLLRGEDAPVAPGPGLARLSDLLSSFEGVEVSSDIDVAADDVPAAVQQAVYRIVQEALTNVVRHAGASVAQVSVRREAGSVVVEVADDGAGFAVRDDAAGGGILGMTERAELLGGTASVAPRPGGGTLVRASIPFGGGEA